MRRSAAIVGASAAAVLSACTAQPAETAAPSGTASTTSTTTTTAATPRQATTTATPGGSGTPSSPAHALLAVGKTHVFTDGSIDVTVQKFQNSVKVDPMEGPQLAAALVRACVKQLPTDTEAISFSWMPWSLMDAESGRYPAASTLYDSYPKPWFPNGEADGTWAAGDCVKGWIYFDLPGGTKITTIRYSVEGESAVWAAP